MKDNKGLYLICLMTVCAALAIVIAIISFIG